MAITHAVLREVVGKGLEPFANIGDGIPVDHCRRFLGVAEGESLADSVGQFFAVEAVVMPDNICGQMIIYVTETNKTSR